MKMKENKNKDFVYIICIVVIFIAIALFFAKYFFAVKDSRNNKVVDNSVGDNAIYSEKSNITNKVVDKPKVEIKEEKLSSYSTKIIDKDENRQNNIRLVCETLNGHIVKSGEEFSFNGVIGPMGAEQGYKKAISFTSTGKKFKAYGGGVCQLSSTLYNVCLNIGLEITERHPHSRRVSYVPKDKDATIYYGSKDFKFKNILDQDIKIECSSDGLTVDVTMYKITTT